MSVRGAAPASAHGSDDGPLTPASAATQAARPPLAADPPVSSVVAPPAVTWPDPVRPVRIAMTCPNCGSTARKPLKLTVDFATPDHPMRHSRVLNCPDCTCLFYEDQNPPDYTEQSMLGRGRTSFYLQQGAGVSLITRPLAMVRRPAGSTYLEVGCGFGFGLDFAIRAKGWQGTGIDPAGLSALGRELLGVPIEQRYLGDDEPGFAGTCDVVMASETIEHVPSPRAFLATLKRTLRPGGILILTTPNAAEIDPSRSPGLLVPLLSPGLHLVFQNAQSLRDLLQESGFAHIRQETDSVSLVAFASESPFELDSDTGSLRLAYRAYLENRAGDVPQDGDLLLAFAGRALQESANDQDWGRAGRAYAVLLDVCRTRFGFDLDELTALPREAASCPLERLAELMPLNLGGILFADGMRRLAQGSTPRSALGPRFKVAAAAADALRRALGELAMEDGMSEMIGWAARAEGLLCEAAAGRAECVADLVALPAAPSASGTGATQREQIIERALAWMVNSGHVALGASLAQATGLNGAPWANPPESDIAPEPLEGSRRDALFCLGIIDVQLDRSGDPERGRRRFRALRLMLQGYGAQRAVPDLAMPVISGELQATRLLGDLATEARTIADVHAAFPDLPASEAAALASRAIDIELQQLVTQVNAGACEAAQPHAVFVMRQPFVSDETARLTAAQRDALFALGVLNVQGDGDLVRAESWFARVRRSLEPDRGCAVPDLLWAAMRGEIQAVAMQRGAIDADQHRRALLAALGRSPEETPDDLLAPIPAGMPPGVS